MLRTPRDKRLRTPRDKRNRLIRGGALALTTTLALLAVPTVAGASPACGVYCPSPVPDPGRAPQDKPPRGGGQEGDSGSQGAGSGAAATVPQATVEALQTSGAGGAALSRALGGGRESGKDGRGNRKAGGNGADSADDGPAGASLASVGGGGSDGGGLGFLFPLLLGLIGVWAIAIGVRRLRS